MTDLINDLANGSTPPQDDPNSFLEALVGEGKTFKDTAALAKGKAESDKFIEQLKKENKEMLDKMKELEDKANAKAAVSDLLNELKNAQKGGESSEPGNQPGISQEDLTRLIDDKLSEADKEKTRKANQAAANAALLKKFNGDADKASEYLTKKSQELGLSPKAIAALAQTSPQAFGELVGISPKGTSNPPVFRGSTPPGNDLDGGGVRDTTYYTKLMKEMGVSKFYANKTILNQREQDLQRLGQRFFVSQ